MKIDWKAIIEGFAGVGTFMLAAATFLEFRNKHKLEKKVFLGDLSLEILPSGTIKVTNNKEYPIKITEFRQSIKTVHKIHKYDFYNGEAPYIVSNDEYREAEKEYSDELQKIKSALTDAEDLETKNFSVDPKENISIDQSLAYEMQESDANLEYFATIMRINISWFDPYFKKTGNKYYIYRYSVYKPPQGWVRVG